MDLFRKANIDQLNVIRKRGKKSKEEFGYAPSLRNLNLLEDMLDFWVKSNDAITKSQISQLMEFIGEPWQSRYIKLAKNTLYEVAR